jgi:hypothetical protein
MGLLQKMRAAPQATPNTVEQYPFALLAIADELVLNQPHLSVIIQLDREFSMAPSPQR